MFIDCYQVEEENLATREWEAVKIFRLKYKWARAIRCFRFLFRRSRPEITEAKMMQAVIVKTSAFDYARRALRTGARHHIRITRVDREGGRLVKIVIWLNGEWTE